MQFGTFFLAAALSSFASAALTYTLSEASSPSADQSDAYTKIKAAMDAAIARHEDNGSTASKTITVEYNTGVTTADGNFNGNIRFGSNRAYMTERTALHEISHTLGVGQTNGFTTNCEGSNWPAANELLQTFDGAGTTISCGGSHFWPYGLNYEDEMSDTDADRHVQIINAMLTDGLAN